VALVWFHGYADAYRKTHVCSDVDVHQHALHMNRDFPHQDAAIMKLIRTCIPCERALEQELLAHVGSGVKGWGFGEGCDDKGMYKPRTLRAHSFSVPE
jgi:hypothetical protein